MNLAFTALLVLILAAPGMLFVARVRSDRGRYTGYRPAADELPLGIIVSIPIHTACVLLFNSLGWLMGRLTDGASIHVDLASTFSLLVNNYGSNDESWPSVVEAVTLGWRPIWILSYMLVACAIGYWGSGRAPDSFAERWFGFYWYHLLRGDRDPLLFHSGRPGQEPDGVWLTAVVDQTLFVGILYDYSFSSANVVDTIVLTVAERRPLDHDRQETPERNLNAADERFYEIDADFFVLKYSECRDLGVKGIYLNRPDPDANRPLFEGLDD